MEAISEGANVNTTTGRERETPLHIACRERNFLIAQLLLNSGADQEQGNIYGEIPLSIAHKQGDKSIAQLLCDDSQSKDNNKSQEADTASSARSTKEILSAAFQGRVGALSLIGNLVFVDDIFVILTWACFCGYPILVKEIFKTFNDKAQLAKLSQEQKKTEDFILNDPTICGSDQEFVLSAIPTESTFLDEFDEDDKLQTHQAFNPENEYSGHEDDTKPATIIIANEPKIATNNPTASNNHHHNNNHNNHNSHNSNNSNPQQPSPCCDHSLLEVSSLSALVTVAAFAGHVSVMKQLILVGCDLDSCDSYGRTALWHACNNGKVEMAKFLCSMRCSVRVAADGSTPLHQACSRGHTKIVVHLLQTLYQKRSLDVCDIRGRTPLWLACRGGHTSVLRCLIIAGADISIADDRGVTPFCKASAEGQVPILAELYRGGCSLNARDKYSRTALWHAAKYGKTEVVDFLIARNCDVNIFDENGTSAIKIATERNHENVVLQLIRANCEVNRTDMRGKSPLYEACKNQNLSMLSLLIAHGGDVDVHTLSGNTPLLVATHTNNHEMAKKLLEAGADVHKTDSEQMTALHMACMDGHPQIARLLLEYGGDVEAKFAADKTPLLVASSKGQTEIVNILLEHGCDVENARRNGCSALYNASSHGHEEIVRLLLAYGANPNRHSIQGATPLCTACHKGHVQIVKMLLEKGCDTTAVMDGGVSPLHVASHHGYIEIMKLLLDYGFNKNSQKDNGSTPLLTACAAGHLQAAAFLIQYGCDVNKSDYEGWTALAVASCGKFEELAIMLIDVGCDLTIGPREMTPLHLASRKGCLKVIQKLTEVGVVERKTSDGWTALMLASYNGHIAIAKHLIQHGSDVNTKTMDSITPLLISCRKGHYQLAFELVKCGAEVKGVYEEFCQRFPVDAEQHPKCTQILHVLNILSQPDASKKYGVSLTKALRFPVDLVLEGIEKLQAEVVDQKERILAFCMGRHPRLGKESSMQYVSVEIVELIGTFLFFPDLYSTQPRKISRQWR
jgi:ankyrin repeat protein